MTSREAAALARVQTALERWSLLLLADSRLPSVAGTVTRASVRGSWWAHPQAHAIFRAAEALADQPGVLLVKLLNGKATYVHPRLWPALFAVATTRQPWQTRTLSPTARSLLARVQRAGVLRTDRLTEPSGLQGKLLGDAARELESRLLIYSEAVHTAQGSHAKQLESWEHLARRRPRPRALAPEACRQMFEAIAATLAAGFGASVRLPWSHPPR